MERWSERVEAQAVLRPGPIGSILVLKLDHIGDFILGFDALVVLRRAFPQARIELLCAPWNETLARSLQLFDDVRTLAFFDKRADGVQPADRDAMVPLLPRERYDLAIDLRVDADTRMLLRHIDATYRCGFDSPDERDVMVLSIPHYLPPDTVRNVGMHQSMLMLRLVRSVVDLFQRTDDVKALLLGRVAEPCDIDLAAARGRPLVAVNTSSGRAVKNWPADRWERLVRWLAADMDVPVLLLGGKDQADETAAIVRAAASPNVISAVGRTSFGQAVGLVAQASLFIGNDSSLTHVAARLDIPAVVLFSGIDPVVMWSALGPGVTLLRAPVPCSPCHILQFADCVGGHACMRNITEANVRAAVRNRLLAARPHGEGHGVRDDASYRGWVAAPRAQVPERYGANLHRYLLSGGELQAQRLLHGFTDGSDANRGDLNRFYFLLLVFDQILKEQLPGDVAELGVFQGNTATMLAELARRLGTTAWLLDTFEGFSAADLHVSGVDADKGMAFADTSLERVRARVGESNTRFVKGFFPDTAGEIAPDARFCLAHIDCDLYAPFRAALDFFYDRLVPGGFLVMHDYGSLHWHGAARAADEFFADKPEALVPVPDGGGTVVVRKSRAPSGTFGNWYVQGSASGFANAWVRPQPPLPAQFLARGWSAPEEWGVWGLGPSHVLSLMLTHAPEGDIELAAETQASLMPGRRRQTVQVFAGGRNLATWSYSEERNTGVRTVVIPRDAVRSGPGLPVLEVEFRPASFDPPRQIDPRSGDERPLGMGLLRFRQRPVCPGGSLSGRLAC